MRTEFVNNLADKAIYHFEYYKNLYLVYKKVNKILLILLITIIICLISFLVYYYLEF